MLFSLLLTVLDASLNPAQAELCIVGGSRC